MDVVILVINILPLFLLRQPQNHLPINRLPILYPPECIHNLNTLIPNQHPKLLRPKVLLLLIIPKAVMLEVLLHVIRQELRVVAHVIEGVVVEVLQGRGVGELQHLLGFKRPELPVGFDLLLFVETQPH